MRRILLALASAALAASALLALAATPAAAAPGQVPCIVPGLIPPGCAGDSILRL